MQFRTPSLHPLRTHLRHYIVVAIGLTLALTLGPSLRPGAAFAHDSAAPVPLIPGHQSVDWWFVFKFNTKSFEGCGGEERRCLFGGDIQKFTSGYGQQYVYASSADPSLQKGEGCLGDTLSDPVGKTFSQIYHGDYYYVLWNDQFYGNPMKGKGAPWGHSKDMLAWNDDGNGLIMQVSTPSWPGSGSAMHPRQNDGNTLGCVADDDVEVSQHFFALELTKDDLLVVLRALLHASVVTDTSKPEIFNNGGPSDVQELAAQLGKAISKSKSVTMETLSSGVRLISKASHLNVPPWQMVSAQLGGVPLRTATWWAHPQIPSTKGSTKIECWSDDLGTSGDVEVATTGQWDGTIFGLKGGSNKNGNHAKIGISTDDTKPYSIFGDMNQQGALFPRESAPTQKCKSSQNGRGGMFFVLENKVLTNAITDLIKGKSAPLVDP